ncbi:hypothetical protein POVWA2_059960 [Plasmodium ovale wallikeri]|uniref:Uncharacterized protein n=1 Tax=Plasmodium ovale wallikeri TaxID=864142 RepID=A0A1A9A2E1_PLAOA|nr:hypothetical protein POVWA2_059960 [Plasmodium ovale wallikeri]
MKKYSTNSNIEKRSINDIYKRGIDNQENPNSLNGNCIKQNDDNDKGDEKSMECNILNEVVKLKTELKNALTENSELKKRHNEDTEKLNLISLKNASLLSEMSDEKKRILIEYNNYREESVKDIKRLQEELDKNVVMLNSLKDEILFKEEELRKVEIIQRLYMQETEMNQEKEAKIKALQDIIKEKKNTAGENTTVQNDRCAVPHGEDEKEHNLTEEEAQFAQIELERKNDELKMLGKKYDHLKKTNREIEKKICFLREEVDYYKNNENSFIMQNIFNAENNIDDSMCKKHLLKISILYNVLHKIVMYDQKNLIEKDKFIYALEKENTHFLKKFIADEMYCLYLKDCISKINLTYQIDLHKQEKKYMLLNSEYDDLYNKFLHEKNENCILNEKYDKIIFNQKKEINNLKGHISIQNKDKEILTKYIDNYITYIENSYEKYCIMKNDYKNLEELVKDLEEKNKNLMILVNGLNMDRNQKIANDFSNSANLLESNEANNFLKKNTITMDIDHMKLIKNDIKDRDIKIIELESKNLELAKRIDKLNEEMLKNRKNEYSENEFIKIKDLCFDLKDICSRLELEIKEKNYVIEELTEKLNLSEKKNKDNQVILELSEFRIQNFHDNVKYYQEKVNELSENLQKKESDIAIIQDYNDRLKEEKDKANYEKTKLIEGMNRLQGENDLLRKEAMFLRNEKRTNSSVIVNTCPYSHNDGDVVGEDSSYMNEKLTSQNDERRDKTSECDERVDQSSTYKGIFNFVKSKKTVSDEKSDLEVRVNKLTDENILLMKENEEIFNKLEKVSSENVKIKNELMYARSDAEKSSFYLEYEKKEKLKYKLLLRQKKRKGKELKRTFNKMMGTVKHLVVNIKRIDRENKKHDMNNSFFISSSSENGANEAIEANEANEASGDFLSQSENANTQFMPSSVSKSRNSANHTSVDGKHSFYSRSTKVPRLSESGRNSVHVRKKRSMNRKEEKKTKIVYMKIRMHRFSICGNFKINLRKYKKAYRELDSTLCYLNEKENDNLNLLAIQQKNCKGLETFYSIPNSTDSKVVQNDERTKQRKNLNHFSVFQTGKMINDLNYIKRKYDSKVKETLIMQKKLIDNEKELNCTSMKYENLLKEHDSLISDIKERTEKLTSIENDYNLLFEKYSETQDEIKMHEKKTKEIFNECNELVEYMKKKENKIKEFDEHLKKMEIKYKEEKEKNDILTKDNISLDNLHSKLKEDIDLYKKKLESMQTELKLRISKIEELELIQKNAENEMFYLKSATHKYEMNLKEAHDELNKTNEATIKLEKELHECKMSVNVFHEQILNRDYFLFSINESYKKKEYFYKNVKQRVRGFNKTFIELCENFELGEMKKFNELYEHFEFNDSDYKKNILHFQLKQKERFADTVEEIVQTVDALSQFNQKCEEEKNELLSKIHDLENKLNVKMHENSELYEQYENNMKKILLDRDERVEDCLILSEDVKKKNNEIYVLTKELEGKNVECNEINMKCSFLTNEVKNLECSKIQLKEKLRDVESHKEKQIQFLKKENKNLKDDIFNIKNVLHDMDEEIAKLKETVDNLNQEKYTHENELDKLREIVEEEKRFNDMLKENEQNFIREIKEAHQYAIKKEEEINTLKLTHELEKKNQVDEIEKLKTKNKEIQDSVKNKLKMVSDLELQMLEYKVLLDKNTSMKMLVQDLENKIDELIKDNEKLCIDLKKEKLMNEEKEKNILSLNEDIRVCETKIHEHDCMLLRLRDEKEQLNQEIFILNDIKKSKDSIIEELENNLRKAVFGDVKLHDIERTQPAYRIFTDEDLGIEANKDADFSDLANSKLCIFNNASGGGGTANGAGGNGAGHLAELKKYSLFLKEENDAIKQELRKMKDKSAIDEKKNDEMEKIIQRRDDIIRKMNQDIVSYNEKVKILEKDTNQLHSELYAVNELLALRSDECKELSMELYELTDVKNKLMVKNEVLQKQVDFFKHEVEEKSELLNDVDLAKVENENKEYEKNAIIKRELNGKGRSDRSGTGRCASGDQKDGNQRGDDEWASEREEEALIDSLNVRNPQDLQNSDLESVKLSDANEISNYINEFLRCVRLLIFRKRIFESKLENAERKYNDFKEKLKEDRDLINDLKKKLRHNEEYNFNSSRTYDSNGLNHFENENFSVNYKELSTNIQKCGIKNDIIEKKDHLLLKYENEKLTEENKYLHEQLNNFVNLRNSEKEMRKTSNQLIEKENISTEYTYIAENKYLKFQVDTITNELNICRNKNVYLKKKTENYEDIIDHLQKEIIKIIDKQKECDEEFYKIEKELEKKNENIEHLVKKREEDQELMEKEFKRYLKLENEFLILSDDIFKKESKVKEYEEIVKKLNHDVREHILEKEELKLYAENLKNKYGTFENKYKDLYTVLEKEKQGKIDAEKKEESALVTKLKNYDDIISELLKEKEELLNKYEELKRVYDEKLKIEASLHKEISELRKRNELLAEKNNTLGEQINNLVRQNEQYNIKLVDLDKEKFDLYMKFLKTSEELNNITSSSLHENHKPNLGNKKRDDDDMEKYLSLKEKQLEEREKILQMKLDRLKEHGHNGSSDNEELFRSEKKKENEYMQNRNENDNIIISNIRSEMNDLTMENDKLKEKVIELERLNGSIYKDNKELINIISSLERGRSCSKPRSSEKGNEHSQILELENYRVYSGGDNHDGGSNRDHDGNNGSYTNLVKNTQVKEENENLKMEIYNLKSKIDEYSTILNKRTLCEESNKRAKNYLYYLNDKIKGFIEIFSENNFNYEFFKSELKKIKLTNLMIIEDNFEKAKGGEALRYSDSSSGNYSLDGDVEADDRSSVSSKIVVNFFTAHNERIRDGSHDGRYQADVVIDRLELKKFYKYIIRLKEDYSRKCLLVDNQKNTIEELNREIYDYSRTSRKYQEEEEELKRKINEVIIENSANVEKFSKMYENMLSKLEEEVEKNNNLLEKLNVQNEQNRVYEENQKKIENALICKGSGVCTTEDGEIGERKEVAIGTRILEKINTLLDQYNDMVKHNSSLYATNSEILTENHTLKEVITKMNKEITSLTEQIDEKNVVINGKQHTHERSESINHQKIYAKEGSNKRDSSKERENNVIREYEDILLVIERKNNELENNCEYFQKHNDELNVKYNKLLSEYNSLKDFVERKKIEFRSSTERYQNEDGDDSHMGERSINRETEKCLSEKWKDARNFPFSPNDLLILQKHIDAIEILNDDFLKNDQLEGYINLIKNDLIKVCKDRCSEVGSPSKNELVKRLREKENEIRNYEEVINNMNMHLDSKEEIINNLKHICEEELQRKMELKKKLDEKMEERNEEDVDDARKEEMFVKMRNGYEELLNEYNISLNTLEETKEKLELLKSEKDKIEKLKEIEKNDKEYIIKKLELINNEMQEKAEEVQKCLSEELQQKDSIIKNKVDMLDQLSEEVLFLKSEKSKNNKYVGELELQIANLNNEINTLNNLLKDSKEEINFINSTLDEKEKEIADLRNRIENYVNQLNDVNHYENTQKGSKRNSAASRNAQSIRTEEEEKNEHEYQMNELKRKSNIQKNLHFKKLNELRIDLKNSFASYNKLKFDSEKKIEDYEEEANNLKHYINRLKEENDKKDKNYALIEMAIKEMDKEIIILKADLEQKCILIENLEKNFEKGKKDMHLLDEDIKVVEHIIMNYLQSRSSNIDELVKELTTQTKTTYLSFLKEIMKKVHQNFIKVEFKRKDEMSISNILKKEKEVIAIEERLNNIILEKDNYEKEVRQMKQQVEMLHDQKNEYTNELRSVIHQLNQKKEEMNQLSSDINELDRREGNMQYKENNLMNKSENYVNKEMELIKSKEELIIRENDLINRENELINRENEIIKGKEELINKTNEFAMKKEKLHSDQMEMEKLKNDLMVKFEKLNNAQNDVKIKETKLKKIYEKLKGRDIAKFLDVNNDAFSCENENTGSLNILPCANKGSIAPVRKLQECDTVESERGNEWDNAKGRECECPESDASEQRTFGKEFKKRVQDLKSELLRCEKEMEIYQKTLEIEKREKEIYKMELEKVRELLHLEQLNRKNLDEELERYRSDDTHILKSLKESEELINEKNGQILELQQRLIESSYEITMIDNSKNMMQEKNIDYEKKIEQLNSVITNYEKEISDLNKEKLNITRKSIEKIIDDGEDIKQLKEDLGEAHELIHNLKNQNEEFRRINLELQEASKDMRSDIDVLLANIEELTEEKRVSKEKARVDSEKYSELKIAYEEKAKECKSILNTLSEKMKRKTELEKSQQNSNNKRDDQSARKSYGSGSPHQDFSYEEKEQYLHALYEKNMLIESLNGKLDYYDKENLKKEEIINEYKSMIDQFSSKVHVFEDNLQFLLKLNEYINENDYTYEGVLVLLNDAVIYRKIMHRVLFENQFYKEIIQMKGYLFEAIKKNVSTTKETLKLSLMKKRNSKKRGGSLTHSNYPMHMSENIYTSEDKNDEQGENFHLILKNVEEDFTNFENACIEVCSLYQKEDWSGVYKKLSMVEYTFVNVLNCVISEMKKLNKKSNNEKNDLKKNMKMLKKKFNSLSDDFLKNVEEIDKLNLLLTKECEHNELLIAENDELKKCYKELSIEYNDKLVLIQNKEYELENMHMQLAEKSENKTKAEKINEFLKTDLSYLNTSLDQATQNLSELNNENRKNRVIVKELTEENVDLKNQLEEKTQIIEHLENNLESKSQVINELREFNEMLIQRVEDQGDNGVSGRNGGNNGTDERVERGGRPVSGDESGERGEINENELLVIIDRLESDNYHLKEELDVFKSNYNMLKEEKEELEEVLNGRGLSLSRREIDANNVVVEKENIAEETNRYKIKCIQIIDICFNKDFNIVDIREKIVSIFQNEDDEIINIINCHQSMLYNNDSNNKEEKSIELQEEMINLEREKIIHIEEMSKKNEELIKKNEEIWNLNKYIENLNKEITNKNYIIIKNQQNFEDKNDMLEKNKEYIKFLKEQIKLLCNNIDENNLFNINNVNLSPTLRSFIKRKSYNERYSFVDVNEKETYSSKQDRNNDLNGKTDFIEKCKIKRLSECTNKEEYNFYDENEVKLEEMNLKMDELNDKLTCAEKEINILKNENNNLVEKCEYLKNELKDIQGTKRNLMLCESRLHILEKELEEKEKKLDAQNKTVNECVDMYVEENSENFNKILELKKVNENYKIEINVLNDEICKLKLDIQNYKNDIKNLSSTLDFYKSTHDELVNEFSKEETNNVYYKKLCEIFKNENELVKEKLETEEEHKEQLLKNINDIRKQLNDCIKENHEIVLDLEFFQMQNKMLRDTCNYYKERELILVSNINEEDTNVNSRENYKEKNLKTFINKLKNEINHLQDEVTYRTKDIISLKYQIKEYHLGKISTNEHNLQHNSATTEEIVNINNMVYIQNSLFIYISLFKSVLFIISEILFFADPTNELYLEILTLLKLRAAGANPDFSVELDNMINSFELSKGDCDHIFQSVLKSKNILREKLQLLQLKIS